MKPWESKGAPPDKVEKKSDAPPPFSVVDHVKGIAFLIEQSAGYWREMGKKKPLVAQFLVPGDAASSWYVQVDGQGARAAVGVHASPTVTWESDLAAMEAGFRGEILRGRVRVIGDFEEMRALFKAIAQTQVPGLF